MFRIPHKGCLYASKYPCLYAFQAAELFNLQFTQAAREVMYCNDGGRCKAIMYHSQQDDVSTITGCQPI